MALALSGSLVACNNGSGESSSSGDSSSSEQVTGGAAVGNYVTADVDTRTEILGKLEKYAVDNTLTGLPLYENSGYTMYQDRVVKGVQSYITGYGFGILRSGSLNGTLSGDVGSIKPTYYHTLSSTDPGTVNVWDASDSQTSDLQSYMGCSFYGTRDAADGTSYEWIPILARTERPYIVENGVAREATETDSGYTWRFYVRTNDSSAVYRTMSDKSDRTGYDGRQIVLEDYLTTFKIMLTGGFGMYRGEELAGQTGKYGIQGASQYYSATANATTWDDELFSSVGVKTGTDATMGDYIEMTMLAPTTRFYAMYTFSDALYMPIPADFWNAVTVNGTEPGNWFTYNSDMSYTPVDNSLSVGPYVLESWETDIAITFAKNTSWKEYDPATGAEVTGIYNIPGVYINIFSRATEDANAAFLEFLDENIDACSIPSDYLDQYKGDSRAIKVPGDTVWKLNVNSCSQSEWEAKFGENGTVTHTAVADYYQCKPWMSNDDFVKGLFFSLNREQYAENRGCDPSIDYFGPVYMSDPENGVAYNTTEEHEAALEEFWGDTVDTYGYSSVLAQAFFDDALTDLISAGSVTPGQALTVQIVWQEQRNITQYGEEIKTNFENVFNACSVATANGITLSIDNYAPAVWSDAYYKHLMVGQFDLGFGSISGNSLDPLNFMEVLKSNNSSGFTLNWGPDTSVVGIDFDNKQWSFDSLWAAADHGICTYDGAEIEPVSIDSLGGTIGTDGTVTVDIDYTTGEGFLKSKAAEDASAQAVIDSGTYSAGLSYFDFVDENGGYAIDLIVTEDGSVYDNITGVTNPEGVTATFDTETEKATIVLSKAYIDASPDRAYVYFYNYFISYGYDEATAAAAAEQYAQVYGAITQLYTYVFWEQRVGDLETSSYFQDPNVVDLYAAESEPASASIIANEAATETTLVF